MMVIIRSRWLIFSLLIFILNNSCGEKSKTHLLNQKVELITDFGNIIIQLSDDTPVHRDNFIKLTKEGFFDGIIWHRVIDGFLIQTGDPTSKNTLDSIEVGAEDVGYDLPAEIRPNLFHKRGAINAARWGDEVTPNRRSSGSQFTIIQGVVYNDSSLNDSQEHINKMTAYNNAIHLPKNSKYLQFLRNSLLNDSHMDSVKVIQKLLKIDSEKILDTMIKYQYPQAHGEIYRSVGGAAHLDKNYTVFGEVIEGMHIVDSIAKVKTRSNSERPLKDVRIIKARLLKSTQS